MIGIPMNPNSIYVSMIQTGCCKGEFDSTYPIHLNGIIGQEEFRESIDKINRTVPSTGIIMFVSIIFVLSVIGGTACCIIGGTAATYSDGYGFPSLIGVGIALSTFGSLFFIFGFLIINIRRTTRLRQVVAEESMKYSSRSPTPCSWRLETTRQFFGGYGNSNNRLLYHLVIDIGRSTTAGIGTYYSNSVAPESSSFVGQQNNYAPPPYSGQSTAFCSQCGAVRQDLSARFCSSCGHSFNKN